MVVACATERLGAETSGGVPSGQTYHLQLILPKLLLPSLIKKREIADVVDKDVAQDRELRIFGGDLAVVGLEGGSEAAQGRWGVELVDLPSHLLRDKLALQICEIPLRLVTGTNSPQWQKSPIATYSALAFRSTTGPVEESLHRWPFGWAAR